MTSKISYKVVIGVRFVGSINSMDWCIYLWRVNTDWWWWWWWNAFLSHGGSQSRGRTGRMGEDAEIRRCRRIVPSFKYPIFSLALLCVDTAHCSTHSATRNRPLVNHEIYLFFSPTTPKRGRRTHWLTVWTRLRFPGTNRLATGGCCCYCCYSGSPGVIHYKFFPYTLIGSCIASRPHARARARLRSTRSLCPGKSLFRLHWRVRFSPGGGGQGREVTPKSRVHATQKRRGTGVIYYFFFFLKI